MSNKNVYRNVQSSLMRFARDFTDLMEQKGETLKFVNLDAHASTATWPEGDFIGIANLKVDILETNEIYVTYAISTAQDQNLLRMSEMINELTNLLMPGKFVRLFDADTGAIIGKLFVAKGVRVDTPMATESQPLQPVILKLLSDQRSF